jgi:hypothetical protein
VGKLYPIRTLSVGLAKCVVFSGEIILLFSYTVFRYVRYTGIRDRISNIPLNLFGKNKNRFLELGPGSVVRSCVVEFGSMCVERWA